jgi:hypothetical protein
MDFVDHAEVLRSNLVEQYLLGEVSTALRKEFEEHYFTCIECARDVQAGATFLDASRGIPRTKPSCAPEATSTNGLTQAPARNSRWAACLRPAWVVPAFALLMASIVYQNVRTIPALRRHATQDTPQELASYSLIAQNSRGASPAAIHAQPNKPFALFVDIPPVGSYDGYMVDVADTAGSHGFSLLLTKSEARNTVQLLVPGGTLPPGNYVLITRGLDSTNSLAKGGEIARYSFTLDYKN